MYVPLLAFRGTTDASATAADRESLTFNVLPRTAQEAGAVIAEFPNGFGLDETLIASALRIEPRDRLRRFAASYASARRLSAAARNSLEP